MIGSKTEFGFLRLCFENSELWAIKYEPIDPMAKWVNDHVIEFVSKFHVYPNLSTFLEYISDKCESQQYGLIEETLEVDINPAYTLSKVISYVEKQKMLNGIGKARVLLEEGEIQEAKTELIRSTELVYSTTINLADWKPNVADKKRISTGFSCLDAPMKGGLHAQNIGLLVGPKSSGKSATLLNLSFNNAIIGNKSLHISFEDSEDQIGERYDTRFEREDESMKKNVFVHVFPAGQFNTADCEALVNAYRPSLVIVDYLNEMGWENKKSDYSRDLGERMRGLKAIAKRHNCGVWTAQQAGGRTKYADKDVVAEDAFWSKEPMQVADIVLTINQTKEERERGVIRYIIDRHRNGPDGLTFNFSIDYEKMLVRELRKGF